MDLPVHDDPVHSVNVTEVETFVSEAEALAVAHKFSGKPLTRSMEGGTQAESGMDVKYVADENGEPLMYIINYPDKVGYGSMLLHMNWGWDEDNGWFYFNDIRVKNYDFRDRRKNLYVSPNRIF